MDSLIVGAISALWLGILTSISPCPLATNITAISYLSKNIDKPYYVMYAGLMYTLGRTLTYVILAMLVVASLFSAPWISHFLQKHMNKILGPVLIIVGMVLLELIQLNLKGWGISEKVKTHVTKTGILGAGLLGFIFALSFCPVSAALYFGSLIPLSIQYQSSILLPVFYGIGTAIPVIVFTLLLSLGANIVSRTFSGMMKFDRWARKITGIIFIAVGIYFILVYIFRVIN